MVFCLYLFSFPFSFAWDCCLSYTLIVSLAVIVHRTQHIRFLSFFLADFELQINENKREPGQDSSPLHSVEIGIELIKIGGNHDHDLLQAVYTGMCRPT